MCDNTFLAIWSETGWVGMCVLAPGSLVNLHLKLTTLFRLETGSCKRGHLWFMNPHHSWVYNQSTPMLFVSKKTPLKGGALKRPKRKGSRDRSCSPREPMARGASRAVSAGAARQADAEGSPAKCALPRGSSFIVGADPARTWATRRCYPRSGTV